MQSSHVCPGMLCNRARRAHLPLSPDAVLDPALHEPKLAVVFSKVVVSNDSATDTIGRAPSVSS